MAKEEQYWKDALRSKKQERNQSDDRVDLAEKKKLSRNMYLRRKLDKDIRKIINNNVIRYKDIVEIHNRHSINIFEGPLR